MKRLIAIFLFAILSLTFASESWAISWEHDLTDAFEKAKTEKKPVMADFYTDWCHWCKKLDKDVYEDASVNQLAEKFICVKVNCEIDKGAFSKYGLRGYPTIIFFNASGTAEETVVGYRTAQVFADIMKKVLDKAPKSSVTPQRSRPANEPVIIEEKIAPGEFKLSGIMGSKAIVNDKVVVIGDEVDDAKVIALTGSSVKLRYKDKELTLKMQ
ncbi:MAG: protein disulfide isomerase family protein [Candidatus Omnitrophica bacterium]|nr:protein disulfide isomerase family protein [Candidatus Omnitrophota bacterium]